MPSAAQLESLSMNDFYEKPIINPPYDMPARHWLLDENGQPIGKQAVGRRVPDFATPSIPAPRRRSAQNQFTLGVDSQQYYVNEVRRRVDAWRGIPNPSGWGVTPETARLLAHWRSGDFEDFRPFFCQVEAVETLIWLTEVAPKEGQDVRRLLENIESASRDANPLLARRALKLATGAGKTAIMAMIIAWQTVNAVRHPRSRRFTRGFLVVAPGITIRDRLRVLQPNDPNAYYQSRRLVPPDMLGDVAKAKIVITNYHAFGRRDTRPLSRGARRLLDGRRPPPNTLESAPQMLRRVMPELMGMKDIMALNDEAHHCYRRKPDSAEGRLTGDDRQEAKKNEEAARLWISGLEAAQSELGLSQVVDLSATPFFLRGSGYPEGSIFPWTVSDFSLMDAIECGIVKLPRVPVADNVPSGEMPKLRELWAHIGRQMPKAGSRKVKDLDPLRLPTLLQNALDALYGHYEKTSEAWEGVGMGVPPCFVIVCNNTATSKLVYDYISGFQREDDGGGVSMNQGRLKLFRNFDEMGNRLPLPRTLLIDSRQIESGDALDNRFREIAAPQIEQFERERRRRDGAALGKISDEELLREVMNTVGKPQSLGAQIRCVVSVSMLTEGWDANNVTHILGVRAFGTQLLCEQVVGRALRRQSYELQESGMFDVEYADVLGVPFDFTAQPVVAPPSPPSPTTRVQAVRPERDSLEIRFPRVVGYRIEPPNDRIEAEFTKDSVMELTPDTVGPTRTRNEGIIGAGVDLDLSHTHERSQTVAMRLAKHMMERYLRDPNEPLPLHLFGQVKRIVSQWLDECLVCKGDTMPSHLLYQTLADTACERIHRAITRAALDEGPVRAMLDPYTSTGSTKYVDFTTSKRTLYRTDARKSHVNFVVLDGRVSGGGGWEAEFCRVAEAHPRVVAYVKNHRLGLEVPYEFGSLTRKYIPDFILQIDDGREDPLNLIVEIKGYRGEDAKIKKDTMETRWVPGVDQLGAYGRWEFAEFSDVYETRREFDALIERIAAVGASRAPTADVDPDPPLLPTLPISRPASARN